MENKIFGIGIGSFGYSLLNTEKLSYPHNIITEILSENGILGFSLFLLIVIYTLFSIVKLNRSKKENFAVKSFVISLFISSFLNANISGHIGRNLFFWLSMGLILLMVESKDSLNSEDLVNDRLESDCE